jgi:hypothetical protein
VKKSNLVFRKTGKQYLIINTIDIIITDKIIAATVQTRDF